MMFIFVVADAQLYACTKGEFVDLMAVWGAASHKRKLRFLGRYRDW